MSEPHGARIARYELPGRRWYFAACYDCRWVGMDWKHKDQAKLDRADHNKRHHSHCVETVRVGPCANGGNEPRALRPLCPENANDPATVDGVAGKAQPRAGGSS